jgi:hypothetical protein
VRNLAADVGKASRGRTNHNKEIGEDSVRAWKQWIGKVSRLMRGGRTAAAAFSKKQRIDQFECTAFLSQGPFFEIGHQKVDKQSKKRNRTLAVADQD